MALKFYTDVHIAREVVRQLRQKGVDILHCGEVDMAEAEDQAHWVYATQNERVLVTCDSDFERLNAEWQAAQQGHHGIVYITSGEDGKDIGFIVKEILFLHEASEEETDLVNQVWRA